MGNIISFTGKDLSELQMSNRYTSILIETLCISGCELARSPLEKELMIWLAQHDQNVFGLGMVGFDIRTICWKKERFVQQKKFILKVIETALQANRDSNQNKVLHTWIDESFVKLQAMFNKIEIEDVDLLKVTPVKEFSNGQLEFKKCKKHGVYFYSEGCIICNGE